MDRSYTEDDYYGTIETGKTYLEHFGIKCMKWGVRRFENRDGSLTAAGKKRYRKYDKPQKKLTKEQKRALNKELSKTVWNDFKKDAKRGRAIRNTGKRWDRQIEFSRKKYGPEGEAYVRRYKRAGQIGAGASIAINGFRVGRYLVRKHQLAKAIKRAKNIRF